MPRAPSFFSTVNSSTQYSDSADFNTYFSKYSTTNLTPEQQLMAAVLLRALFDLDYYLNTAPQRQNIEAYKCAKDAWDFVMQRGIYIEETIGKYRDFPFLIEEILLELFPTSYQSTKDKLRKRYKQPPQEPQNTNQKNTKTRKELCNHQRHLKIHLSRL